MFVPRGSTFPYLLKPDDDGETYRMLGFVFVYGLMNGEFWKEQNEIVKSR